MRELRKTVAEQDKLIVGSLVSLSILLSPVSLTGRKELGDPRISPASSVT